MKNKKLRIVAIPVTPPGAILLGDKKQVTATEYIIPPTTKLKISNEILLIFTKSPKKINGYTFIVYPFWMVYLL